MALDLLEKLSELTNRAVGRLTVRSALNPLLWLCGIVSPICFAAAYLLGGVDHLVLLVLVMAGVLPIVLTCAVAGYFAVIKPEKLQSEDYQLRSESLRILREKGGRLRLDPASLESIANPPVLPPPPSHAEASSGGAGQADQKGKGP